jgi:hypothetical protein
MTQNRGAPNPRSGHPPAVVVGLLLVAFALVAAVTVFAGGCSGSPEPPKTSMKGWELYSWQEEGHWYFSLLGGTNRTKTIAEVHAADTKFEGIDGLRPALQGIATGQLVTWWTPSWTEGTVSFPPTEMVEQVRRICEEQGLELQVVTQGP